MKEEILNAAEMEKVTGGTNIGLEDNMMEMVCPDPKCDGIIRFRAGARKVRCLKCKKIHIING